MSRAQRDSREGLPARPQMLPPAIGSPGHSASIARSKMPRLTLSHTQAPDGARGCAVDARYGGQAHTARTAPAPTFLATLGETTPRMSAGSYTERLGERDPRRPLAFDMRDQPSSRAKEQSFTFSRMDRVRTAPTLSEFTMSGVQSVAVSSLDKPTELDNWPSTTSAGSNSWLRRLEHFLDVRLQTAADSEAKLQAYHECFAQFSELFKGYRPLLSRIHNAYDEHINNGKAASLRVTRVEAEMFALHEHAQATVRKSAQTVTDQLKGMREYVAKIEKERAELQQQLADARKHVEDADQEVEREKAKAQEVEKRANAYCSGYRWIMKHVVKTEVCVSAPSTPASWRSIHIADLYLCFRQEPNELDALESVTLIQKLEKAQSETHSQQKLIQYYTSTAEIEYCKSILELERKAYAEEVERINMELDNMRYIEGDCRQALIQAEDKIKTLETEMKATNERLNNTFMLHLGDGPDIPEFLRTAHPIVNRGVERADVLDVLKRCYDLSAEAYNAGKYPKIEEVFAEAIKQKYSGHTVAEWSRNVIEALDSYRDEYDCRIVGSLLASTAGSHLLIHRSQVASECAKALSEFIQHLQAAAGDEEGKKEQDEVSAFDLMKELHSVFPLKTQAHLGALKTLLQTKPFVDHKINVVAMLKAEPHPHDTQLLELLGQQLIEEVEQYTSELRAGLLEDAGRRKSKKSELRISVADLRARIKIIEPLKPDKQVASMVHRGFHMASYEEAFNMLFGPQDEFDEVVRDAGKETGPGSFQPIDRVLMRFDLAQLTTDFPCSYDHFH